MTPDESAVVALVERADWRRALDHMRPRNFQGTMIISQNVLGDLADAESLLEQEQVIADSVPETMDVPAPKGLKYIEGIGDVYRVKLFEAGIRTVEDLLEEGSTVQGRKEIAEQTGISSTLLLTWINHADLYRIHGIGPQYAELLEAAGVDTVPELAQRIPANLLESMGTANAQKKRVRHLPALAQVESWVTQAKELPRRINY
jgi:predicted flap endonuclease-1-like 5' DNA nuclease